MTNPVPKRNKIIFIIIVDASIISNNMHMIGRNKLMYNYTKNSVGPLITYTCNR